MNNIAETVIASGGYKLTDIQRKIKKLYIMGDMTEDEMCNLLVLASAGVSPDA